MKDESRWVQKIEPAPNRAAASNNYSYTQLFKPL